MAPGFDDRHVALKTALKQLERRRTRLAPQVAIDLAGVFHSFLVEGLE